MAKQFLHLQIFATLILLQTVACFEIEIVGKLPRKRGFASSVYDGDDSVFILAGNINPPLFNDVIKYSLSSNKVTKVAELPLTLCLASTGTNGNGTFFHLGGVDRNLQSISSIFAFTSDEPTPELVGNLPRGFSANGIASDGNGAIYIVGGAGPLGGEILRYNTITGAVDEEVGSIPENLYAPTSAWVGDSMYIFGGLLEDRPPHHIYKFTPENGQVEVMEEELVGGAMYAGSVAVGNDIYVIGGINVSHGFYFSKFNTVTKTLEFLDVTNFSTQLLTPSAVYVHKLNRIYVFGGADQEAGVKYDDIFYIQL